MYHVCLTGLHAIHGAHYPHMADYAPGSSSPRGLDSSRGGSPAFSFGSPRIFSNHLEWDDEFRVAGTVEICEHLLPLMSFVSVQPVYLFMLLLVLGILKLVILPLQYSSHNISALSYKTSIDHVYARLSPPKSSSSFLYCCGFTRCTSLLLALISYYYNNNHYASSWLPAPNSLV